MIKFVNVRCRKCGKMISIERNIVYQELPLYGYIDSKDRPNFHNCKLLQEDEKTFLDLISTSDTPLKTADEVIYYEDSTSSI